MDLEGGIPSNEVPHMDETTDLVDLSSQVASNASALVAPGIISRACDGADMEQRIRVYESATGADAEPFSRNAHQTSAMALQPGSEP